MLLWSPNHDPPLLTLIGADADPLRAWIAAFKQTHAFGLAPLMHPAASHLDPALILELRARASPLESLSQLFVFLAEQIPDEERFSEYLLAAFGAESDLQQVAYRWWRGAYPPATADRILRWILTETARFWHASSESRS